MGIAHPTINCKSMTKSIILTVLFLCLPNPTFALTQANLTPISNNNKEGLEGSIAQNPSNQNLENIAKNITVRVIGDAGKG